MNIISIHIFPHEIQEYGRIINLLDASIKNFDDTPNLFVHVTLNKNPRLVEWGNTPHSDVEITKDFITINESARVCVKYAISTEERFSGVNEHRRETIENSARNDTIFFLDCDLHFNKTLLVNMLTAVTEVKHDTNNYIISPQVVRLWDPSWDCLVHPAYKNQPLNFHQSIGITNFVNRHHENMFLTKNNTFKWGGGWFNAISAELLKFTGIPESFVGYGPDDTFIMACCRLMKMTGHNVQQYILNNTLVVEGQDGICSSTKLKETIPNFRENCDRSYMLELKKFKQKL